MGGTCSGWNLVILWQKEQPRWSLTNFKGPIPDYGSPSQTKSCLHTSVQRRDLNSPDAGFLVRFRTLDTLQFEPGMVMVLFQILTFEILFSNDGIRPFSTKSCLGSFYSARKHRRGSSCFLCLLFASSENKSESRLQGGYSAYLMQRRWFRFVRVGRPGELSNLKRRFRSRSDLVQVARPKHVRNNV